MKLLLAFINTDLILIFYARFSNQIAIIKGSPSIPQALPRVSLAVAVVCIRTVVCFCRKNDNSVTNWSEILDETCKKCYNYVWFKFFWHPWYPPPDKNVQGSDSIAETVGIGPFWLLHSFRNSNNMLRIYIFWFTIIKLSVNVRIGRSQQQRELKTF